MARELKNQHPQIPQYRCTQSFVSRLYAAYAGTPVIPIGWVPYSTRHISKGKPSK
eukprot:gene154-272_t